MLHGAMVPHSGRIDTRMGKELTRLGSDFKRLGGTLDAAMPKPKAALVFTWESWWALESSSIDNNAIRYEQAVLAYYRALWELGIDVMIDTKDDLSPYNLLLRHSFTCAPAFSHRCWQNFSAEGLPFRAASAVLSMRTFQQYWRISPYLRPLFGCGGGDGWSVPLI